MTKEHFERILLRRDLEKSRQNSRRAARAVKDQASFDKLFTLTLYHGRPLATRAVDAIEKITLKHPEYLVPHKQQLLSILKSADYEELKCHIGQLISRIDLTADDIDLIWNLLTHWTLNKNERKSVRVNALQGLFELSKTSPRFRTDFLNTMETLEHEIAPSIQKRIRKLRNLL